MSTSTDVRITPTAEPIPRTGEAELVARIIAGARPSARALALARDFMARSASDRSPLGPARLQRDHGLTRDQAARLAAAWELAAGWTDGRPALVSSRDVVLLLEPLRRAVREQVSIILLDARHRCIDVVTVAVGSLNASRLLPRDVLAPALQADAAAVIVGHNHPSGDPSPSDADRLVTDVLRDAGRLVGIPILDHVIIAAGGHYSFRESEAWDRRRGRAA